jgi:hypothetical protein
LQSRQANARVIVHVGLINRLDVGQRGVAVFVLDFGCDARRSRFSAHGCRHFGRSRFGCRACRCRRRQPDTRQPRTDPQQAAAGFVQDFDNHTLARDAELLQTQVNRCFNIRRTGFYGPRFTHNSPYPLALLLVLARSARLS